MCAVEKGHDSVVRLLLGQPGVNENGGRTALHCAALDKAPRLSIRIVIWILLSDTVFVNSKKYQQILRRQCYLVGTNRPQGHLGQVKQEFLVWALHLPTPPKN